MESLYSKINLFPKYQESDNAKIRRCGFFASLGYLIGFIVLVVVIAYEQSTTKRVKNVELVNPTFDEFVQNDESTDQWLTCKCTYSANKMHSIANFYFNTYTYCSAEYTSYCQGFAHTANALMNVTKEETVNTETMLYDQEIEDILDNRLSYNSQMLMGIYRGACTTALGLTPAGLYVDSGTEQYVLRYNDTADKKYICEDWFLFHASVENGGAMAVDGQHLGFGLDRANAFYNYYHMCQPKTCSYTAEEKPKGVELFVSILGLIGGSQTILMMFFGFLVKMYASMCGSSKVPTSNNQVEMSNKQETSLPVEASSNPESKESSA
eukprot:TRINITY_DN745_c0_g1_i1.p1 TRINITY_DN745_c0_g1~~TRINITY_DN745_c0_g1_i1.p1  ORF type:complete len:324 (+),score=51.55 TRINITY_DN745_c0_g1_i1:27-998(+)